MGNCSKFLLASVIAFSAAIPANAGLDVYSGPLGKFYKHDYMSTQEETAKELGVDFKTVYPDGEPRWLTNKNSVKKIKSFRSTIAKKTAESSSDMATWTEETNAYLIEQLNWDSLSSLIHITAYAIRTDLKRPTTFSGDYEEYPAYLESVDKGYYYGPLAVLECDMFLPSKGSTIIIEKNPLKNEIFITTTENLKMALKFLDQKVWHGKSTPEAWFDRGPANIGTGQELRVSEETGEFEMVEVEYEPIDDPTMYNAEYAYGVLYKLLKYAEKHNVPIVMDG